MYEVKIWADKEQLTCWQVSRKLLAQIYGSDKR